MATFIDGICSRSFIILAGFCFGLLVNTSGEKLLNSFGKFITISAKLFTSSGKKSTTSGELEPS